MPIDVRDPATYEYHEDIRYRAAFWLIVTGDLLTPEELLERDIQWAQEIYDTKQTIQFFADYKKRPAELREDVPLEDD